MDSMLAKRIIPCLDIKDGRTVKGVRFEGLRDAGDPVELAARYSEEGADELVFLDITATHEKRKTLVPLVRRIAKALQIPFTVGGGVTSLADASALLAAGADKVSVNSAALENPDLIRQLAMQFGNQCVVLAVDARLEQGCWQVYRSGGRVATGREMFSWLKEAVRLGAGEVLFTSMNHDGEKSGYAVEALKQLSEKLPVPIIASGGAGLPEHFREVFAEGKVDAALAASVFHFQQINIGDLKKYLIKNAINVRT